MTDKGHGRLEIRRIWVSDETRKLGYAKFPHSEQFFVVERIVTFANNTHREETVCGVSSLKKEDASAARLLELCRGHWDIENRLHYVRDVTYDEDRSRIRTGNGPRMMASLRNLSISVFRMLGFQYIPQGIRFFSHWNCAEEVRQLCEQLM